MKKYLVSLLFAFLAPLAFAQNAPVPIPPADKNVIELAIKSLQDLQAQGAVIQHTYDAGMSTVKWKFNQTNAALAAKEESIKKELGLPPEAVFDPSIYAFTVPAKPTPPATPPAPTPPATK